MLAQTRLTYVELHNVNKNYPWFGDILHFGKTYSIYTRPQTYLFIWILITTPLFVLVLSPITLFRKWLEKKEHNNARMDFTTFPDLSLSCSTSGNL